MNKNKSTISVSTKKLQWRLFLRWTCHCQLGWNYEKYMALGYISTVLPVIEEFYEDPDDLHKALETHLMFFNTNPMMAPLIIGADMALEKELKIEAIDAVVGIKTGLMGALAGIGDTLFGVVLPAIVLGIAAGLALKGSTLGIWLYFVYLLLVRVVMYYFVGIGYKEGTRLVTTLGDKLKNITKASQALGIVVIAALIPTVVRASTPLQVGVGEDAIIVQDVLNQIMPGMLAIALVALCYWLLGKKNMNSTKLIFIILALGIVLGGLGVLA